MPSRALAHTSAPRTYTELRAGDTVVIEIELLPRCVVEQKLRLRGIGCPEVDTSEGKTAKRFMLAAIGAAPGITIFTTKPDKYDRYLADVFLEQKGGDDVFLNNALLANGHAVRKDEWEFRDWEKDLLR
jgi:endonuclease YncB( thermonuclease family)